MVNKFAELPLSTKLVLMGQSTSNLLEAEMALRKYVSLPAEVTCYIDYFKTNPDINKHLLKWEEGEQSYLLKEAALKLYDSKDVSSAPVVAIMSVFRRHLMESCAIYKSLTEKQKFRPKSTARQYLPKQQEFLVWFNLISHK